MIRLFAILIILISLSPVNAKECNLIPEPGSKNYIIGYGSLMEKESRTRTNKSALIVKPILIEGFERTWGQSGGIYKITFLTIIQKKNSKVNAVYYPVSLKDLDKTDRRESGYCRVKVKEENLSFYEDKVKTKNKNFWVYSANLGKLKKPSEGHPIVQSYVDIFMNGCFQIKEKYELNEFPEQCVETTKEWSKYWVNDRIHARRPFLVPNFYKIDKLLSKYFDHYFDHKFE
ncbi:gamma-glutamylcyclotransferase [Candidatus Pelagibacter bacterium]|nr:gamma-glutamylcyclotransferase [Candidatus Pelagibacter bacterium]